MATLIFPGGLSQYTRVSILTVSSLRAVERGTEEARSTTELETIQELLYFTFLFIKVHTGILASTLAVQRLQ